MFYNLGIYIYGGLIKLASSWNKKAQKWVNGRKGLWSKLPSISRDQEVYWFHCASLGEYDQGLPLMERFKKEFPNCFLLVTFFSPSGYEALKDKSIGDYTCYLPLDTKSNATKFINHFKPKKVFFVKYEYWLNYIDACSKNNCQIYGLSAVFQEDQRFFKWYGGRFKKMIDKFEHFFLQNENSARVLTNNSYKNFTVTGDTRYDRVLSRAKENKSNAIFDNWGKSQQNIIVIGSSWPRDEQLLLPLINENSFEAAVILAPHEVNKEHIDSITKELSRPFQKYTDLEKGDQLNSDTKVIILDCIGVLANAYKYGDIAYVGGAFGTGLHNILEPASFGLPVIFGPIHSKFPEAQDFINEGIGSSIHDRDELLSIISSYLSNDDINKTVTDYILRKSGATEKVMSYFK